MEDCIGPRGPKRRRSQLVMSAFDFLTLKTLRVSPSSNHSSIHHRREWPLKLKRISQNSPSLHVMASNIAFRRFSKTYRCRLVMRLRRRLVVKLFESGLCLIGRLDPPPQNTGKYSLTNYRQLCSFGHNPPPEELFSPDYIRELSCKYDGSESFLSFDLFTIFFVNNL